MHWSSVLRGTVFRLAGAFVVLAALAFFAVGVLSYHLATDELQSRLDRRILREHNLLIELLETSGEAGLKVEIDRKARSADDGDRIYLLMTSQGDRLAGNVEPFPCRTGWNSVEDENVQFLRPQSDDPDIYFIYGTSLRDLCVMTGRSNEDVEETQEIVLETLGWGLLGVVVIGLLGAILVGLNAQSRMNIIENVLSSVARGDLTQRIPVSGGGDINRIADSINRTLVRLERAVDSLKQVSVDIAHELKTPISRLRNRLETAQLNSADTENYAEAIDAAITETKTIVATFEALLRIAAIEAGARRARFSPVDLRQCLETVAEIYAPVADDAGHTFTSDLPQGFEARVIGDEELLVQMLVNVVENAIRHCPAGAVIKLGLSRSDDKLLVSVTDSGPGIPETEQKKVFDRLYRIDKSRTGRGNGLGLSLVAAIADLHGAEITLANLSPGLSVRIEFQAENE